MNLEKLRDYSHQFETNRAEVLVIEWLKNATQQQYNEAQTEMVYLQNKHEKNAEEQRWEQVLTHGMYRYLMGRG